MPLSDQETGVRIPPIISRISLWEFRRLSWEGSYYWLLKGYVVIEVHWRLIRLLWLTTLSLLSIIFRLAMAI